MSKDSDFINDRLQILVKFEEQRAMGVRTPSTEQRVICPSVKLIQMHHELEKTISESRGKCAAWGSIGYIAANSRRNTLKEL
jgi:hypothetical protein